MEKTWNNCVWFDSLNECPYIKDPLIKQFTMDTSIGEGYQKTSDFSKGPKINEKFCNNCTSFKAIIKN